MGTGRQEKAATAQRSMLAVASVFRGSHLPPHRLRCSSCFSVTTGNGGGWPGRSVCMVHLVPQPPGVRPDQIRRTTGDQEGMLSH